MRIILDTYILLSALLSPLGAPAKLLDVWERKIFTLVACEALISEYRNVVSRPFFRARLRASLAEWLAAGLRDYSLFCRDLPSSSATAPDPKDSYLLALAEASQAEFLVTDDKERLFLKQHKSTQIFEKVRDQARREAEKGGKDQARLLRNLDFRQRTALTLFQRSREIATKDVADLFGYKPRTAALLCQRWVERGFLVTTDLAKKSRRYKLGDTYAAIVDEID